MTSHSYINFDLSIERVGDNYRAHVLQSGVGNGQVEFSLPFSTLELENFTLKMGHARLGGGRSGRKADSSEMAAAKEFGSKLFGAVFQKDVYACLRNSMEEAKANQQGVRVLLRLPSELANVPWEYLYNRDWNQFFSLSTQTPLVRYLEMSPVVPPLKITRPLRLLVVISSPSDYRALDVEREWRDLRAALKPLMERGLVVVERLESASLLALQRQLRRNKYHILHFIGHGIFDESKQDGVLIFTDEAGKGRPLSGQDLGTLLRDHNSLRLVVLNACEGARTGKDDLFAGAALSLVQMGIPAVIAMQYEISDSAATLFAHEFYTALADGYGVDAALGDARKAIFASGDTVEWGTPVLFSRTLDGRIFDLAPAFIPPRKPSRRETFTRHWKEALAILIFLGLCGIIFILLSYNVGLPGTTLPTSSSIAPGVTFTITPTLPPTLTPIATIGETRTSTVTITPTINISPTITLTVTPTGDAWMVLIPAGEFKMGNRDPQVALSECQKYYNRDCTLDWYQDEIPVHSVTLNLFKIDRYEVTNAQYAVCVGAGVCMLPGNNGSFTRKRYYDDPLFANYPVVYVSWFDASAYCAWRGARLPTEAEWEKAARGGQVEKQYPWGDAFNGGRGNFCDATCLLDWAYKGINDGYADTAPVGSYPANDYGLYDMVGNVWEWTADWYGADYYQTSPANNPTGPVSGTKRTVRGGAWYGVPGNLRVALRDRNVPTDRRDLIGFRCVTSLP
jgi:formylglycine-generating enzyme required for sulfatase activity